MMRARKIAIVFVSGAISLGVLIFLVGSARLLLTGKQPVVRPEDFKSLSSGKPSKECSVAQYEPDGRSWEQLKPATPVMNSEGCVGYCFNGVIESEDDEDPGIARVVILEEDATHTRATVQRSRVTKAAQTASRDGKPVRFACFDSYVEEGTAPRFEDCVQMLAFAADGSDCVQHTKTASAERPTDASPFDRFPSDEP